MKLMRWLPQAVASVVAYRYSEASLLMLKRGARDVGTMGISWFLAVLCALAGSLFLMGALFLWLNEYLDTPVAALLMAVILGVLSGLLVWRMTGAAKRPLKSGYALGK